MNVFCDKAAEDITGPQDQRDIHSLYVYSMQTFDRDCLCLLIRLAPELKS